MDKTKTHYYGMIIPHLTKEKWLIALVAQTPEVYASKLTDAHFVSIMFKRIKLHNDIWIVPLITLIDPWFVVYNKDYCDSNNDIILQDDDTMYIVEPLRKWGGRISCTLKY